jgi:Flp pilus assembly protein TadD
MVDPMTSHTRPPPSGRVRGRFRKAKSLLVDPRSDPADAVAFARALAGEGETRRALAVLAETTRIHATSREAWALRGALALAVGDSALAECCSIGCAAALFRAGFGAVADLRRPAAKA